MFIEKFKVVKRRDPASMINYQMHLFYILWNSRTKKDNRHK
jgi:hypothetical protein